MTSQLSILFLLSLSLAACSSPEGRAAKTDINSASASVKKAQDATGRVGMAGDKLAASNASAAKVNAAAHTDAQRIDDKAQVLLNSKW